jgi:beta-lactamase regulating signal transducer with metallopeptidase domain
MNIFDWYLGKNFILWQLDNFLFLAALWIIVKYHYHIPLGAKKWILLVAFFKTLLPPALPFFKISRINSFFPGEYYLDTIVVSGIKTNTQSLISNGWLVAMGLITVFLIFQFILLFFLMKKRIHVEKIRRTKNGNIFLVKTPFRYSPFVIGTGLYFIFVPFDFHTWPEEKKNLVIAHELGHIQNGDPVLTLLLFPVMIINVLNPFFWILWKQFRQISEVLADQKAAEQLNMTYSHYAKTLLEILEYFQNEKHNFIIQTGLFDDYSAIRDRIVSLVQQTKEYNKMRKLIFITLISIVFSSFVIISCSRGSDTQQSAISDNNHIVAQNVEKDVYDITELTKKPQILDTTPLQNTPEVITQYNLNGTVVWKLLIDETGKVSLAEAVKVDLKGVQPFKSAQEREENLERALSLMKERMKTLEFSPAEIDGKPVKTRIMIPITYRTK